MECSICKKEVPDKGKGFIAFVEYQLIHIFSGWRGIIKPILGKCRHQIRICAKCLKYKNYSDIKL